MTIKFSSNGLKYQSENEQQSFNPQTPSNDHDGISPYNTISSRKVIRIKKI